MPLGILELLTRIGEDDVRVQNLFDGDVDITTTKRGTRLCFYTDPRNVTPGAVMSGSAMVALVVWMPREAVDRVLADITPATPPIRWASRMTARERSPQDASGPAGLTPDVERGTGAPAAGSREAVDALRECIERVRDRLTKFRYRTGPCPFCRSTVHAADCALIPIMDDTAAALEGSAGKRETT